MAEYTNIVFGEEDKNINFYDDQDEKLEPTPKESFCAWLLKLLCSKPV